MEPRPPLEDLKPVDPPRYRIGGFLIGLGLIVAILINASFVWLSWNKTMDFGSFAASGINLRKSSNPYDPSSDLIFDVKFPVLNAGGRLPNLNPPVILPLFELISENSVLFAVHFWRVVSILMFALTLIGLSRIFKGTAMRYLWAASITGAWHTFELGQIYIPLLVLTALIWTLSEKENFILAGVFLGILVSIKPNLLVWVMLIAFSKNWKYALAALATVFVLGIIPIILYGGDIYREWLNVIRIDSHILPMPGNSSISGILSRLDLASWSTASSITFLTFILVLCFTKIRPTTKPNRINEIGLLVSLLISPLAWTGYTILLLPAFLSRNEWKWTRVISAAILSIPFWVTLYFYQTSRLNAVIWGSIYMIPLVLTLYESLATLPAAD